MKLDIHRSSLLAALAPCVAVADPRSPLPYGACVALDAGAGRLSLYSTCGYSSVRTKADATIGKPGTCAVPAKEFLARAKVLADGPLSIALTKDKLTIKQGTRQSVLRTLDAAGMPAFPAPAGEPQPLKQLAEVLSNTLYVAADREARFDGVVLTAREGKLTATASNGTSRFARVVGDSDAHLDTFLPSTMARAIVDLGAEDLVLYVSGSKVHVSAGDVEMAFMPPDIGSMPYDIMYSKSVANDVSTVKRDALLSALRTVTPDGVAGSVPVTMTARGGVLRLSAATQEGDISEDEIAAGGAWSATVEAKYAIDAVSHAGEDVELGAAGSAFVVRSGQVSALVGLIFKQREDRKSVV